MSVIVFMVSMWTVLLGQQTDASLAPKVKDKQRVCYNSD